MQRARATHVHRPDVVMEVAVTHRKPELIDDVGQDGQALGADIEGPADAGVHRPDHEVHDVLVEDEIVAGVRRQEELAITLVSARSTVLGRMAGPSRVVVRRMSGLLARS